MKQNTQTIFHFEIISFLNKNNEKQKEIKKTITKIKKKKIDSKEKLKFALLTNRIKTQYKKRLISFVL